MSHYTDDERSWELFANCLGSDPDLFFPERGDMAAIQQALAICRGCSVTHACLDANLHELDGVWGGKTSIQRQRIRLQRRRSA